MPGQSSICANSYEWQPLASDLKAAEAGDAQAQFICGSKTVNDVQALEWFRKAAEQGHATAQLRLGEWYLEGRAGLPKDDVQALEWFRKAAEQGHATAQLRLGEWYVLRRAGLPKDDVQALEWVRKAVEQRLSDACFMLGNWYVEGRAGLPKDDVQALEWFRKAAEQGHANAQFTLGKWCVQGRGGIRVDYPQALKWFRKAADQGHEMARKYAEPDPDFGDAMLGAGYFCFGAVLTLMLLFFVLVSVLSGGGPGRSLSVEPGRLLDTGASLVGSLEHSRIGNENAYEVFLIVFLPSIALLGFVMIYVGRFKRKLLSLLVCAAHAIVFSSALMLYTGAALVTCLFLWVLSHMALPVGAQFVGPIVGAPLVAPRGVLGFFGWDRWNK
jgi:hypothetical protein